MTAPICGHHEPHDDHETVEGRCAGAGVDVVRLWADYDAARAEMDRMTTAPGGPGAAWRWSIPAKPERDSDLILDRALSHLPALLDELEALRASVSRVQALVEKWDSNLGSGTVHQFWAAAPDVWRALEGPSESRWGDLTASEGESGQRDLRDSGGAGEAGTA